MAGRFAPKNPVNLNPPKDDIIEHDYLAKCNGRTEGYPTYVAIKTRFSGVWPFQAVELHKYPTARSLATTALCFFIGALDNMLTRLMQGKVFDVTGNKAYGPEGGYKVFAGHDASRALAMSSLKPEDVRPDWEDLGDTEKKTLEEWETFFGKRYNIVGLLRK